MYLQSNITELGGKHALKKKKKKEFLFKALCNAASNGLFVTVLFFPLLY